MRRYTGRVVEVGLEEAGMRTARIACPRHAVPAPGRYLLAVDGESPLGLPLFLSEISEGGFTAAPAVPAAWQPGSQLALHGPLGRGFHLPGDLRRLALAASGETAARLLPLAALALSQDVAITLFSDARLPRLPLSVEAYPLSALPEALGWADFLAIDLPSEALGGLRTSLGLSTQARQPCPGQVLVTVPMPCAGLAECGVCAVLARRAWQLACKDGPVFDLKDLLDGGHG